MKTKIIYISGSEIFNMNDVRDAFETVRKELGLTHDTVLFGVPVDKEDALGEKFENAKTTPVHVSPVDTESTSTIETQVDDIIDVKQDVVEVEPKVKPKRTKKKVVEIHPEIEEIVEPEPQIDITEPDNKPDDAIIPILSVWTRTRCCSTILSARSSRRSWKTTRSSPAAARSCSATA